MWEGSFFVSLSSIWKGHQFLDSLYGPKALVLYPNRDLPRLIIWGVGCFVHAALKLGQRILVVDSRCAFSALNKESLSISMMWLY